MCDTHYAFLRLFNFRSFNRDFRCFVGTLTQCFDSFRPSLVMWSKEKKDRACTQSYLRSKFETGHEMRKIMDSPKRDRKMQKARKNICSKNAQQLQISIKTDFITAPKQARLLLSLWSGMKVGVKRMPHTHHSVYTKTELTLFLSLSLFLCKCVWVSCEKNSMILLYSIHIVELSVEIESVNLFSIANTSTANH